MMWHDGMASRMLHDVSHSREYEPGDMVTSMQFFAIQRRPQFLTWIAEKPFRAAYLVHNAFIRKWQHLIIPCWVLCETSVYLGNRTKFTT